MGCPRRKWSTAAHIMVDTDTDPSEIGGKIIDAVRHRPAEFLDQKVMDPDFFRVALRAILAAVVAEIAHQLLLLGVDRDTGCCSAKAVATWVLMWANCASRSGWLSPSLVLRLPAGCSPLC